MVDISFDDSTAPNVPAAGNGRVLNHEMASAHRLATRARPVFPERFLALASDDPVRQLQLALSQIDTLLRRNAKLEEQVSALGRTVADIRRSALHDDLTGLPNRRLLSNRFEEAVASCRATRARVALAFLDLDGFKAINDSLGYLAGDLLLQQFARRLATSVRSGDTVCRYRGDEFVVLLTDLVDNGDASAFAPHFLGTSALPYVVDNHLVAITCSVGIAHYGTHGESLHDLIRCASALIRSAKVRTQANGHGTRQRGTSRARDVVACRGSGTRA
jgi:diguanylate cyclase (GGDEF)-like protein